MEEKGVRSSRHQELVVGLFDYYGDVILFSLSFFLSVNFGSSDNIVVAFAVSMATVADAGFNLVALIVNRNFFVSVPVYLFSQLC